MFLQNIFLVFGALGLPIGTVPVFCFPMEVTVKEPDEVKPTCPKCGSALVQAITNGTRCGQCGTQWALVRDVIAESARQRKATGFVGNWRPEPSK